MNSEILWPEEHDKLFAENERYRENASIMPTDFLTAFGIAESYARVAEIAVANTQGYERNMIIYAVAFCYRHAVEVYLKLTLAGARRLFNIPIDPTRRDDHHLWELWSELRPLIERRWPNGRPKDMLATEAMVKEFDDVDRKAQRFRFATDSRTGERHFAAPMVFDLENFCRSGRKILGFLAGCSDGMAEAVYAQEP